MPRARARHAGAITREFALELVEAFFIKANQICKLRSWGDSEYFPGYHLAQNLAIGGQTADGKDAVNDLTRVILDATAETRLTKPSVSLKWFEGTPDAVMHRAFEVMQAHQGGQPALYNDAGVMRILHDQNAFRSSIIHDCIERGKDLIEGGARYTADGGPVAGGVTVGDSFAALQYVLFDRKLLNAGELMHALDTDFQDETTSPTGPQIRQMLVNKAPKFGNDEDYADRWTVEIDEYLGATYQKEFKSSRWGKGPVPATFALSLSSVTGNVAFGKSVGATPDGRRSGAPLNNGVSPSNGSERHGPTAVINSEGKLPSIWFQKGSIFNMRLSSDSLTSLEGRARVLALVKTHFRNNQYHIQFNVVDDETLRDAQNKPEE